MTENVSYYIATGDSTHKLKLAVEKAANKGWKLQGGVALALYDGGQRIFYAQALVNSFAHSIEVDHGDE